jgi:hypothetical protein
MVERGQSKSDPVNVRDLAAGMRVILVTSAGAEIVSNPEDGVWLGGRCL